LTVEKIRPQEAKGKKELAHIVELAGFQSKVDARAQVQYRRQNDDAPEPNVNGFDKTVCAEQGGIPVRIRGHDQVISDQRENQGKGQHVQDGQNIHPVPAARRVRYAFFPQTDKHRPDSAFFPAVFKLEPQRMEKIGKPQAVKDDQADEIPREKKRYIQPHFLAVEILVKPRENMVPA